jgi:hypothetical protein
MTQRKVIKNVTDMEIDEISVVDRGGNQFADVVIAKRADEEESVPDEIQLFDEHGEPVSSLEDGQVVYDEGGNAYQFEADDEVEGIELVTDVDEDEDEDAGEEITDEEIAAELDESELELAKGFSDTFLRLGTKAKSLLPQAKNTANAFAGGVKNKGVAGPMTQTQHKANEAGGFINRNKGKIAIGAAGTAGGAGAVSAFGNKDKSGIQKSFSEEVMEELSKAMTDEDRDEVLSKALGAVEQALEAQAEYAEIAKSERELRLTNEYIAKAADYNLPVDPAELGPVLYRMVETMSHEDCSVIAKCLDSASTALFDEVGFIGGGDNVDPLERVNALAAESVSKSDQLHGAFLDVMDSNPGAYDDYLASRRGY